MKIVDPINIFNTVTVDYGDDNTPLSRSTDYNLPEWDSSKSDYALGDEVKVQADRKKYKLATISVDAGVTPKDNPAIWIASPLAEFTSFDYNNEYAGEFTTDYKFTISNANSIDTLFFQGIDGNTITVELLDGNDVVLDTITEDIYDWKIESFGQYLFPNDPVLKLKIEIDFISLALEKIRVIIAGDNVKCRYCVAGYKDDHGITLREGVGYNINNFYTSSRDAWGNLIDTDTRIIEDVSLPVLDTNNILNTNVNKIGKLYGAPKLFIADDRDKAIREFDFINIFGKLTSANITPGGTASQKILKIEGK
jgi:hypothetical protein